MYMERARYKEGLRLPTGRTKDYRVPSKHFSISCLRKRATLSLLDLLKGIQMSGPWLSNSKTSQQVQPRSSLEMVFLLLELGECALTR